MPKRADKRKYRPYPDNEGCPCESNIPYGQCCKQKNFKFLLDERGRVHKRIELHPRLKPVLKKAELEFREMFGRSPGPRDQVVFNHHLAGEDDFWQQARQIGRTADVPEQLIFAWRRSGFIVGEHSRQLMPENEYQEWTDAIDEYFAIKKSGFDPFFVFTYLSGQEYEYYKTTVGKLGDTIIALGFGLTSPKRFEDSGSYFRYLLMQRAIRSLRTIREMYNTRYDDDSLSIARTLYEAYLRMKLLRLDPKNARSVSRQWSPMKSAFTRQN